MPKKKKSLKDKGKTPYGGKFDAPILTPEAPMDHEEIAKELSTLSGTKSLTAVDTKTGDVLEYIGRKPGSKGRPSKKSDIVKGPFTVGFEHGAQKNMKPLTFGRDEIERPIWTASGPLQGPGLDKKRRRKLRVLKDQEDSFEPRRLPPGHVHDVPMSEGGEDILSKIREMMPDPPRPDFLKGFNALGSASVDNIVALAGASVIAYRAGDTKYMIGKVTDWVSRLRLAAPQAASYMVDIILMRPVEVRDDEWREYDKKNKAYHKDLKAWKTEMGTVTTSEEYHTVRDQVLGDKQGPIAQEDLEDAGFVFPKKPDAPIPPGFPDPRHSTIDEQIMVFVAAYMFIKNPQALGGLIDGFGRIVQGIGEIIPG